MVSSHYYDWKPTDTSRIVNSLQKGGKLFKLPVRFRNGMAQFGTGLQTKRGACYVVSDWVMKGVMAESQSALHRYCEANEKGEKPAYPSWAADVVSEFGDKRLVPAPIDYST